MGLCWSRIWATSGTRFCLTKLPEKCTIYSTMVGLIKAKNYNFGGEFVNHMVKAFTLRWSVRRAAAPVVPSYVDIIWLTWPWILPTFELPKKANPKFTNFNWQNLNQQKEKTNWGAQEQKGSKMSVPFDALQFLWVSLTIQF